MPRLKVTWKITTLSVPDIARSVESCLEMEGVSMVNVSKAKLLTNKKCNRDAATLALLSTDYTQQCRVRHGNYVYVQETFCRSYNYAVFLPEIIVAHGIAAMLHQ